MVKHLLQKIQQQTWIFYPLGARLTELRENGFDVRVVDTNNEGVQGRSHSCLQNYEEKNLRIILPKTD